jgi:hypothetical protein
LDPTNTLKSFKQLKISIKSSTAVPTNAAAFEVGVEVTVIAVEV